MKKLEFKFSTIQGPQRLVMSVEEAAKDDTIRSHVAHVVKISEEGAVGATFNHPLFGKLEINLIEESAA